MSIDQVLRHFWTALQNSPGSVLFMLALFGGFVGMADMKGIARILLGLFHTLLHIITLLFLIRGFAIINLRKLGWHVESVIQVVCFAAEMLLIGGLAGGFVIGVYLLLSHLLLRSHTGLRSVHANEVFNCQAIPDYKHFLRFHLDSNEALTIYPIGVQKVVRKWRLNPTAVNGQAWFEPTEGSIQDRAELIENPITIA
jgi:hypothetical protein